MVDTTWREQTVVDATTAIAVEGDPMQLAMLGINPMTAWGMLHGFTDLKPGAWVAQTGASSATAGYVRALARRAGFRLVDIVRRPESEAELRASGAEFVLVDGPDISQQMKAMLGRDTIDLLIDGVGGPSTTALASRMSVGGTIISYTSRGGQPVSVNIAHLIFRGLVVRGFWLKHWQDSLPKETIAEQYRELAALVADGTLHSTIEATYPLDDFTTALEHAARRDRTGKILFAIS
jgi:NADPH:quinone reductase-like Zn-dependent oxidoreductase